MIVTNCDYTVVIIYFVKRHKNIMLYYDIP